MLYGQTQQHHRIIAVGDIRRIRNAARPFQRIGKILVAAGIFIGTGRCKYGIAGQCGRT